MSADESCGKTRSRGTKNGDSSLVSPLRATGPFLAERGEVVSAGLVRDLPERSRVDRVVHRDRRRPDLAGLFVPEDSVTSPPADGLEPPPDEYFDDLAAGELPAAHTAGGPGIGYKDSRATAQNGGAASSWISAGSIPTSS